MSALESLSLNRNARLRGRRKGRYAVLLLTTPPGWRPGSPTSLPPSIVSARFMVRHCRCLEASAACQAFNLSHLQLADFQGEWAVVVSSQFGVIPELAQQPEPCACDGDALAAQGIGANG
jgi:hypothetical protein